MNWIRYVCLAFCVFTLSITGCVANERRVLQKMVEAGASPLDVQCALGANMLICMAATGAKK
jgi:hypothetical protein